MAPSSSACQSAGPARPRPETPWRRAPRQRAGCGAARTGRAAAAPARSRRWRPAGPVGRGAAVGGAFGLLRAALGIEPVDEVAQARRLGRQAPRAASGCPRPCARPLLQLRLARDEGGEVRLLAGRGRALFAPSRPRPRRARARPLRRRRCRASDPPSALRAAAPRAPSGARSRSASTGGSGASARPRAAPSDARKSAISSASPAGSRAPMPRASAAASAASAPSCVSDAASAVSSACAAPAASIASRRRPAISLASASADCAAASCCARFCSIALPTASSFWLRRSRPLRRGQHKRPPAAAARGRRKRSGRGTRMPREGSERPVIAVRLLEAQQRQQASARCRRACRRRAGDAGRRIDQHERHRVEWYARCAAGRSPRRASSRHCRDRR